MYGDDVLIRLAEEVEQFCEQSCPIYLTRVKVWRAHEGYRGCDRKEGLHVRLRSTTRDEQSLLHYQTA
jgi:hypothetical protein